MSRSSSSVSGLPVADRAQLDQGEHQVLVAGRDVDAERVQHVPEPGLAAVLPGQHHPPGLGEPVIRERARACRRRTARSCAGP